MSKPYQLCPPLRPEERGPLAADIAKRGVLIPVEKDTDGNILDGHHRAEIADELGIGYPEVVREFATEADKQEHALVLNLFRRHLEPIGWGQTFKRLLELRGVERRRGPKATNGNSATVAEIAAELGVPERTARRNMAQTDAYEQIAEAAAAEPERFGHLAEEAQRTGRVASVARKLKVARQVAELERSTPTMPVGRYHVLVVDPPWRYDSRPDDPTHRGALPYPSMSIAEITTLPVAELATDDAVLWLWTTNSHQEHAYGIARAWGFEPKTALTWVKDRIGVGNWLRGQTEHCLFCVKGSPVVTLAGQSTVLYGPAREHSAKPDEFYALVEGLCHGSKCELFARRRRDGWMKWGDEVPAQLDAEELAE